MECVYCKKTYRTTSSLLHHQRTAIFCIKEQKQQGITNSYRIYNCYYCKQTVSTKHKLELHINRCKTRIKEMERESEKNVKTILEQKEDECEQLASDLRHKTEEFEFELRLKDQKINELQEVLQLLVKQYHIKENLFP
jgi:hypothetical protein